MNRTGQLSFRCRGALPRDEILFPSLLRAVWASAGDRSDSLFVKDVPFSPSLSGPHRFERRVMVTNPLEAFEPSSRSPEKSHP